MRVTILAVVVAGTLAAWSPVSAQDPAAAFENLKALEGRWAGQYSDGSPARATYEVHSRGSAVAEHLNDETGENMITVYHMDQDDLRLTHFCSENNQPRMKATSISVDARVIVFEFVDATNLATPTAGHMRGLRMRILDDNHIEQEWIWRQGEEELRETIHLSRVK